MATITLIVEINTYTHRRVIECFGVGGYGLSSQSLDECHLGLTVTNDNAERGYLAKTIDALMASSVPFTISYHA